MSKAALNGINLYYEEEGEGPPLMLISGYTTDMSAWDLIRHKLAKHFRLILVDNRGVGRSDSPDIPYSIECIPKDTRRRMSAVRAFIRLFQVQAIFSKWHTLVSLCVAMGLKFKTSVK